MNKRFDGLTDAEFNETCWWLICSLHGKEKRMDKVALKVVFAIVVIALLATGAETYGIEFVAAVAGVQ